MPPSFSLYYASGPALAPGQALPPLCSAALPQQQPSSSSSGPPRCCLPHLRSSSPVTSVTLSPSPELLPLHGCTRSLSRHPLSEKTLLGSPRQLLWHCYRVTPAPPTLSSTWGQGPGLWSHTWLFPERDRVWGGSSQDWKEKGGFRHPCPLETGGTPASSPILLEAGSGMYLVRPHSPSSSRLIYSAYRMPLAGLSTLHIETQIFTTTFGCRFCY